MTRKKNIMIVDDSPETTYTVKDGLEDLDPDCKVICVDSGDKCLEILKNNEIPDLIILDIMMPGLNGWQVYKKLRTQKKWTNIPILFLTARSDPFSKGFGKILGDAFVEKPFTIEDLKNKIERILKNPYELSETKKKIIQDAMEEMIH